MTWLDYITYLRRPIFRQIDRYYDWRGASYPFSARRDREQLREFVLMCKIRTCSDITAESCKLYVQRQNSQYFRNNAACILRKFIRYLVWAGYLEVAPIIPEATIAGMTERIDTRVHWGQVKRVKSLRDEAGLSFRKIQSRMQEEDNRPYNLKMIHSWYSRSIPSGV